MMMFLICVVAVLLAVFGWLGYTAYSVWRSEHVRPVVYFTFEFADWDEEKEFPCNIVAYGNGYIQYVTTDRYGRWWDAQTRKRCSWEQSHKLREQFIAFHCPPPPPPQFPEHLVK